MFSFMQWAVLVFICFLCAGCTDAPLKVEIISIIPYNLSIGVALPWTGAALDVAKEDVNHRYAGHLDVIVTLLYEKEDTTCVDTGAHAPILLAEYYNNRALNRCVAVIASGCGGLEVVPFLAREWNLILFSNAVVSSAVFNPVTSPTSVGMAGSYDDLALGLLRLLRVFSWFHVTVLTDVSAQSELYGLTWKALQSMVRLEEFLRFRVDGNGFTAASSQSIARAIKFANERSRVFLILAHTLVVIKFLRSLQKNGITGVNEHVFVVLQPTQQSGYGAAALFDEPSDADFDLFRSVLYITISAFPEEGSAHLNDVLANKEKMAYGTVLENNVQPLDSYCIRETYNSVQLVAKLVNESNALSLDHHADDPCGGRKLIALMVNRTFSFPSGKVYIDPNAYWHPDLLLFAFHTKQRKMQVAGRYDSSEQVFLWKMNVTVDWFTNGVPSDVPACGFNGDDDHCRSGTMHDQNATIIIPVLIAATLMLMFSLLALWSRRRINAGYGGYDTWWLIGGQDLVPCCGVDTLLGD